MNFFEWLSRPVTNADLATYYLTWIVVSSFISGFSSRWKNQQGATSQEELRLTKLIKAPLGVPERELNFYKNSDGSYTVPGSNGLGKVYGVSVVETKLNPQEKV